MARQAIFAVLAVALLAGAASAQSQVRLDPGIDGGIYISSESSTAFPFFGRPSVVYVGISPYYSSGVGYVLKFDVSGIGRVLDAKLVVYFPYVNFPDVYYLAWFDGGNQSVSPSTVNLNDLPTGSPAPHFIYAEGGPIPPAPGFPYSGGYWDITDELNSDLASGHSDYVITVLGQGYQGLAYQPLFTMHLGQGYGDAQGSPLGPYILYTPAPIPEPATLALLGLGLACSAAGYRRRRRKAG